MSLLNIYFYFIILSFIVSLFVYKYSSHTYLIYFPPFLLATLVGEFVASYLGYLGKNNVFIYNFFSVVEFCFYMLLVSNIIHTNKAKRIIRICSLLYAVIAISNILFFQGMKVFHTITYCLGCLLIVGVCIYYFFELFRSPKSIKLSRDPAFWICSGLLFFYCCGFPLYAFVNFWGQSEFMARSFGNIFTILNIFLYSLFTIAFLCSRTRNYISSPS
jgi:hypothetical protein